MLATPLSKCLQILPVSLHDPIKNIIKNENYEIFNVEIKRFNTGGANFLSELYEVDVKGETDEGEKQTNLFIKKKIILNKMNCVSVNDVYSNEEFVYNDLSKVFKYLQEQANVPLQERYKITKVYDVTNEDAIILDNLTKRNFKTYNRCDVIPLEYAKLAIKELAKFHGLSFVIENKMPEYFNSKIRNRNNLFRFDDDWRGLIRKVCKYIENMYKDNDVVKRKIENYLPVILDKTPKYNNNKTTVICTLTHGDYRMNNVLVREQDGMPIEVMPVDYQLIDYGCPIRDFLYFIFTGSDQEFRRKNLNNLKELYFVSLSRFLKYFDMDVEDVYPRKEFEKIYSEWLDYGFMTMMFCAPFIFAPDTGVDMQDINLTDLPLNFDDRSQRLIREWVEDFIQWGYL